MQWYWYFSRDKFKNPIAMVVFFPNFLLWPHFGNPTVILHLMSLNFGHSIKRLLLLKLSRPRPQKNALTNLTTTSTTIKMVQMSVTTSNKLHVWKKRYNKLNKSTRVGIFFTKTSAPSRGDLSGIHDDMQSPSHCPMRCHESQWMYTYPHANTQITI